MLSYYVGFSDLTKIPLFWPVRFLTDFCSSIFPNSFSFLELRSQ